MENDELIKANEYNIKANGHFKAKELTLAIENYSKAIEVFESRLNPEIVLSQESIENLSKYYSNRANSYMQLEEFERAIDDAEKSINLTPNNFKSHYRRGLALKRLKKYSLAKESLSKAYKLVPNEETDLKLTLAKEVGDCIILEKNLFVVLTYNNNFDRTGHQGQILGVFDDEGSGMTILNGAVDKCFKNLVESKPHITKIDNTTLIRFTFGSKEYWQVFSVLNIKANVLGEIPILLTIGYDFPFQELQEVKENREKGIPTDFKVLAVDNCFNMEISEVVSFQLSETEALKGEKRFIVKLNKFYE